MTVEQAKAAGVPSEDRLSYVAVSNGKANFAPRSDRLDWFKLESMPVGNGDFAGVATPWRWPDPNEGIGALQLAAVRSALGDTLWRKNEQAREWIGKPVAAALECDLSDERSKAQIKSLIKAWLEAGWLAETDGKDDKGKDRKFIEVSAWP